MKTTKSLRQIGFLAAVFCFSALAPASAWAYVPNLATVENGFVRSGRPDYAGVQQMASSGVDLVIDLENDQSAVSKERGYAQQSGIDFAAYPMSYSSTPSDAQVDAILSLIAHRGAEKVWIHCKHGEDRTGMIVGLYRVLYEGWSARSAYQEMLNRGFHPELRALDNYFRKRTGY